MAIPAFGVNSWLLLNNVPLSFEPDGENISCNAIEYPPNLFRITRNAPDDLEIWVDSKKLDTERYGSWYWRPGGYAGLYHIWVKEPGRPKYETMVRVIHNKMSYERHEQMLNDISRISVDLLFQLHSPASEKITAHSVQQAMSGMRDYELVYKIVNEMRYVMPYIQRTPRKALTSRSNIQQLTQVEEFSSRTEPMPGPGLNLPVGTLTCVEMLPQFWQVQTRDLTYDLYENQLLKHFIWRQLIPRIYAIAERARNEIKRREQNRTIKIARGWEEDESEKIESLELVLEDCQKMTQWCLGWGGTPFLKSVSRLTLAGSPTQVLQKHPFYSRFYRLYLQFQQELDLSFNAEQYVTNLSLRKMSELFEVWSIFQTTQLILDLLTEAGYQISSSRGFFAIRDDQFHFEVDRDAKINLSKGDIQIAIRYEPLYPSEKHLATGLIARSPTERRPDLSVEVWRGRIPLHVLIFDAKYKVEEKGGHLMFLEEDLEKMNHYMQVIRWKTSGNLPKRIVSSAYILYPGDRLEHDADYPEAGALPIKPKDAFPKLLLPVLRDLLRKAELI